MNVHHSPLSYQQNRDGVVKIALQTFQHTAGIYTHTRSMKCTCNVGAVGLRVVYVSRYFEWLLLKIQITGKFGIL